jgi:energy-coupling factor transporter ATP-binding protein EcfA2
MSRPIIEVENFSFRYFGTRDHCVSNCTFTVEQGEFVLLLGPSGCGKSTICLALNGIIPHSIEGEYSGEIWIGGKRVDATPVPDLAQNVGIVFQDPESQFCMLTVEDELSFAPENLNLAESDVRSRVREAIETVHIQHLVGKPVTALSGGEKQRLALASVLTLQPDVLVFDDVTANLDPVGTRMVFETLRELRQRGNRTVLVFEHKVDELVDTVDRVIIMDEHASVVACGHPREVFYDTEPALLERLGIWIPEIVDLALSLQEAGIPDLAARRPLTIEEASDCLLDMPWFHDGVGRVIPASAEPPVGGGRRAVSVTHLAFSYRGQNPPALIDASLDVGEGDFIAVVGPNGSGKTTLMKHVVGILVPPPGHVFIHDVDLSGIPFQELARTIGFVFQNPEHQIVTDNVFNELAYSLKRRHMDEEQIRRLVSDSAKLFRLERTLDNNPYMLSGGEKRRLGVATMLIVGQDILILDEPTYGQDRLTATMLMHLIQQLNSEGKTIIMVTHDMKLVAEYAREAVVVWDGRTPFVGTPMQLFDQDQLLADTSLLPPPMFRLSKRLQREIASLPTALTVRDLFMTIKEAFHG